MVKFEESCGGDGMNASNAELEAIPLHPEIIYGNIVRAIEQITAARVPLEIACKNLGSGGVHTPGDGRKYELERPDDTMLTISVYTDPTCMQPGTIIEVPEESRLGVPPTVTRFWCRTDTTKHNRVESDKVLLDSQGQVQRILEENCLYDSGTQGNETSAHTAVSSYGRLVGINNLLNAVLQQENM
jgi:hypothetical protein